MINEQQKNKLEEYCKSKLKENFDLFDFEHEIDISLEYEEAKNELDKKLINLFPSEEDMKEFKNKEIKYKLQEQSFKEKWLKENDPLQRKYLDKFRTIAIFGDSGTGKTALSLKILEQYSDKPVFFIKHPKPELIKKMGYANLRSLEEMERLHDCLIYYDEPQLSMGIYDNKTNMIIAKICSLTRQRNITLIISSNDTRCFTRHNESYFDLWIVKDCDYNMVKNGSKVKKAIRDNCILEPDGFRINNDEFLVENRKFTEINGKHTFKLPKKWNDELSKPYAIKERNRE